MTDVESRIGHVLESCPTPGLQYVVVNATGRVFEFATGDADIRSQRSVEPGTTLMAYSMSKTITAAAALQLTEAGRLGLDDPAERYLDRMPYGPRVTVRQLLTHTGGIPNPIPLRWVHPVARHGTFNEDEALAAVLRDHPRLSAEPGTKYAYSNIGYWLLGKAIERASGESFQAYVTRHVLEPLGIPPPALGYSILDPSHHATGYLEKYSWFNLARPLLIDRELIGDYSGRWLEIRAHYLNGPAFGGLVGTAAAFGTFLQDQLRERSSLLQSATRELMFAPQRIDTGAHIPMTLGWHVGDHDGTPFFYKEGGGGGFHCMMRVYRSEGFATVVMSNATAFDVQRFLDTADAAFVTSPNA